MHVFGLCARSSGTKRVRRSGNGGRKRVRRNGNGGRNKVRRSGNGGDGGGSAITPEMPTVTVRDAVRYVRKLSYEFRDQKEKFYMFHQVLVDYRNNR